MGGASQDGSSLTCRNLGGESRRSGSCLARWPALDDAGQAGASTWKDGQELVASRRSPRFLRGEVGAIVRWRKSDNREEYRVHLHRDVWEAVVPELVFG